MPPPGIAPGLPAPQAGVLLLYYSGSWRIRVSIPVLNLAKVVCYHVQQSPMCVHRDSNPNLNLGRVKYYPCTMDAEPGPTAMPPPPRVPPPTSSRTRCRRPGIGPRFAFIAQLAEHALSKRKVTSSILVEGSPCSYGLAWL